MKPKLICLTPVRNEAWCLDVFLKCTSLWADHIIIADQFSTDGSREIALKHPKVILIDNYDLEYNESSRQKILINKARSIPGDKILFALDADEIFTGNFGQTNDWNEILRSRPGQVFGLQWASIDADKCCYSLSDFYFPWIIHDDDVTQHENYTSQLHSMRIPYPSSADMGYYRVNDFKVFHLNRIHSERQFSKEIYYQCLELLHNPDQHPIVSYRSNNVILDNKIKIPEFWISNYCNYNIDIFSELKLDHSNIWYNDEILALIKKYGFDKFSILAVWSRRWFLSNAKEIVNLNNGMSIYNKFLFFYLRNTQKYSKGLLIRLFDKILKSISI